MTREFHDEQQVQCQEGRKVPQGKRADKADKRAKNAEHASAVESVVAKKKH